VRPCRHSVMIDMSRYVPALINHLSNKLSRGASAIYRQRYGIGIIEWRILAQLGSAGKSTARAICDRTALDKAAVSRSFVVLVRRGFIAFDKDAGRRDQIASLTTAGRRLHDRIMRVALERERRFLAPLSVAERQTLVKLLNRLYEHVDSLDD
jgi:DNA-binding MarR family transcriptional regulator